MTTYRLMDGASGRPGVGSSVTTPPGVTSYSSTPFQAGTMFSVTQGGMWLEGFWWWVPTGGDTAAQKFCLWSIYGVGKDQLVPNTTVTSGTLTAGSMNYIPLATPVQLAIGTLYVCATGWQPVAGFPDTNNQFGSGQPYVGGITNGPLTAWSDTPNGGTYGFTAPTTNWGMNQGLFGTGSNGTNGDPTLNFPAAQSNSSNFWIDVSVSDTAPSGYSGSYRIWPQKYDAPGTGIDAAFNYVLATEFSLSSTCTLNNIWFYSPSGATQLPTQCAIWNVSTQTTVSGTLNTAPSWSGAAGSGWVSCAYSGVTLPSGDYKTSVWNGHASPSGFNEYTPLYFTTGFGTNNIVSGPITVPNVTNATTPGQCTYQTNTTTFVYPNQYVSSGTPGQCYWVDVEVTPLTTVTVSGVTASVSVASPAGSIPASVNGVSSAVAVTAVAGTATVTVPGTTASVSVASVPGSITAALTGASASVTVSATAGTVVYPCTVNGVAGAVTAAAPSGSVPRTLNGASASVTVSALNGTASVTAVGTVPQVITSAVSGNVPASLSGSSGTVSAVAVAGTVSAGSGITVSGVTATIGVSATPGGVANSTSGTTASTSVSATAGIASVALSGFAASATVTAVSGTATVSVTGIVSASSVSAASGTVITSGAVTVNGVSARIFVVAPAGSIPGTVIYAPRDLGGSAKAVLLFGGSAVNDQAANYGGWNDQNMATAQNLVALQNNDSTFNLTLTQSNKPLNLTGLTINLYVKATETTPDASATVYTVGEGITVTTSLAGGISWVLPHTAATIAGQSWWRVDVTDIHGNNGTCIYGDLYIVAV